MKQKKILIASDSYKGCMSSCEVNDAIAEGIQLGLSKKKNDGQKYDEPEIMTFEMSDGGEGMLNAFLSAMGGERVKVNTHDALMRNIDAEYGIVGDTAVVEIAQAIGLAQIEPSQRDPMRTTSYGVGEMVIDAYKRGMRHFIIGLGGSATSDCGIGMLRAMGDDWKTLREDCSFLLASDVTNPLCGKQGAAYVFAPQKGANDEMVAELDARARRFADACARHFGYDRSYEPGAGAAGGLGYAFMQFFNARQQSGATLLLDILHFDDLLDDTCLVVTGEGHSDNQTLMGKLPMRILSCARKHSVPVWLVSGCVDNVEDMKNAGFSHVISVTPSSMSLVEAMRKNVARECIKKAVSKALYSQNIAKNL